MIYRMLCCFLASSQLIALSISSPQTITNRDVKMGPWFAANEKGDALLCWIGIKENDTLVVSTKSQQGQWRPPQTIAEIGHLSTYGGPQLYCTIDSKGIPYIVWQAHKLEDRSGYVTSWGRDDWIEGVTQKAENWSKAVTFSNSEPVVLQAIGLDKEEHLSILVEKLGKELRSLNLTSWSSDLTQRPDGFSQLFPETHATTLATSPKLEPFFAFVAPSKENPDITTIYELSCKNGSPIYEKIGEFESEAFYHFQATQDGHGRRALIWISGKEDDLVCVMTKDEERWSSPFIFQNKGEILGCSIAFDDKGNTMIVWSGENTVQLAYKPSMEQWLLPVFISSSTQTRWSYPKVIFDRDHHFVIVWSQWEGQPQIYGTTFSTATQQIEQPNLLTPPNEFAAKPSIAFFEKGKGVIVWTSVKDENPIIRTADLSVK